MQWEEMTAPELAAAVKEIGVCVLPVGCLEKHFDHLPLGTDCLNGHKICCLAAEKEPAVVFPPHYFGQIQGARNAPGAVALTPVLTLQLLMSVCDEIGRNGFRKIIIYNAHGGNGNLLGYLLESMLAERKPYAAYLPQRVHPESRQKEWEATLETQFGGHACERETSITMANYPDLVKMDALAGRKHAPLGRYGHLPPGKASAWWHADCPDHYRGDATAATREKGEKIRALAIDSLVDYIRAVKQDTVVLEVLNDFYDRVDGVGK